jgi:hypothetical protein
MTNHLQPCSFKNRLASHVDTGSMSGTESDAAPPAATVAEVAVPGSAASASSNSGSAGLAALLADVPGPAGGEQLGDAIARLKVEQDAVRANRKQVTKELKNAQKRKQRVKNRAKQLSDTDLVSVLQLRASEKAEP